MNASGWPPPPPRPAAPEETCSQLAASGHSRLIVLHYNHSGRAAGRAGPEDALRGPLAAVGGLVVLGNLLVLAALATRLRARRWVHVCLANVALSDLLTGGAYLANVLLSGPRTPRLAPAHWFLREGLLLAALAASALSLLLTAAERLATMARPWRAAEARAARRSRVLGLAGACWLLAALLGLLPALGWNCVCAFERCSRLLPLYSRSYVGFCLALFACALAAVLGLYAAIVRLARAGGAPRRPKARRLLRTVVLILAAFAVCWGPLLALLLADALGAGLQAHVRGRSWTLALAVANSAVNPLIYTCRSRELRRAVLGLLCAGCLRLGLRGPGDCLRAATEPPSASASATDSSLRPGDSFRGSRSLSFRMREPLASVSSVKST
ncbi:sphingosine 1-phosphate receptor 4 [Cavia porcellus]|uniref:sphingosine 1-phosphate receptor 4 n=1 Tax=Cavia porcellus TaxID=10141 RepID=UPI002FE2C6E7